jgi:hypothetical protein
LMYRISVLMDLKRYAARNEVLVSIFPKMFIQIRGAQT